MEASDTIILRSEKARRQEPPTVDASDPKYIKHVHCEGARFHVLSYDTGGLVCSEPNCIVNRGEGA